MAVKQVNRTRGGTIGLGIEDSLANKAARPWLGIHIELQ